MMKLMFVLSLLFLVIAKLNENTNNAPIAIPVSNQLVPTMDSCVYHTVYGTSKTVTLTHIVDNMQHVLAAIKSSKYGGLKTDLHIYLLLVDEEGNKLPRNRIKSVYLVKSTDNLTSIDLTQAVKQNIGYHFTSNGTIDWQNGTMKFKLHITLDDMHTERIRAYAFLSFESNKTLLHDTSDLIFHSTEERTILSENFNFDHIFSFPDLSRTFHIKHNDKNTAYLGASCDLLFETTDFETICFGHYPQLELCAEELTPEITDARYSEDGTAFIEGTHYKRLSHTLAYYHPPVWSALSQSTWAITDTSGYRYFKIQPIRWRVLQEDNGYLYMMAESVIDCHSYANITRESKKENEDHWASSTIRQWLNEEFANTAFSEEELSALHTAELSNTSTPYYYNTHSHKWELLTEPINYGGPRTKDKIFLPSRKDMLNPSYGFQDNFNYNAYLGNDSLEEAGDTNYTRIAKCTDFAFANGCEQLISGGFTTAYWLRDKGTTRRDSIGISGTGCFNNYISTTVLGVRPVIMVKRSTLDHLLRNMDQ